MAHISSVLISDSLHEYHKLKSFYPLSVVAETYTGEFLFLHMGSISLFWEILLFSFFPSLFNLKSPKSPQIIFEIETHTT